MEQKITRKESYSIASISDNTSNIALATISIDIHEENSPKAELLQSFYTEALMSGCKEYSRAEIHEKLGLLGAEISVNTSLGYLNISLKSTADNIDAVSSLFQKIILTPVFLPKEISRIKTLLKNELLEKKENADIVALENLANELYDKSDRRYSFDPDALIAEISNITKKDLMDLHKKVLGVFWYCTVGGNVKVIKTIDESILFLKPNQILTLGRVHKTSNKNKKFVFANIPSKQNIEFSIGGSLPISLHHEDYPAFMFGLNVLGNWGGFAGRLMSTVREKEGLTYGIYARTETMDTEEFGFWRIKSFFSPEKSEQGLKSTFREINLIKEKGISDVEYKRFKTILGTNQTLLNDSLIRVVRETHSFHIKDFTLEEIAEYKQKFVGVSKDEVNATLLKYLDTEKITVSAAGPVEKVKTRLTKI